MNPYQKTSVLIFRFAALGLIVCGIVQLSQWFIWYSTVVGGSTTFARFFENIQIVSLGALQAQVVLSCIAVLSGVLLLPLSKPLGRLLGRGLEA